MKRKKIKESAPGTDGSVRMARQKKKKEKEEEEEEEEGEEEEEEKEDVVVVMVGGEEGRRGGKEDRGRGRRQRKRIRRSDSSPFNEERWWHNGYLSRFEVYRDLFCCRFKVWFATNSLADVAPEAWKQHVVDLLTYCVHQVTFI
ncbi:hypothetical protein PoB_003572600 [Plakobranchus ocellatus]|uniref:Uncharacterized protein n=1 Tax=Plakobranchus ocellatus TaxID=259542 RepID=A0AAV4ADH2_9GAST|nr:hypothetical protein PoB_003572600 [Plakobranchus ocellatus]